MAAATAMPTQWGPDKKHSDRERYVYLFFLNFISQSHLPKTIFYDAWGYFSDGFAFIRHILIVKKLVRRADG